MASKSLLLGLLLFILTIASYSQDKPVFNFSYAAQENIEYSALKPLFYLVRQEYVIISKNGEKKSRGGNDYFGKSYAIGVITADRKIWFPRSVRSPWNEDPNFAEYKDEYTPECSYTRVKPLDSAIYRSFLIKKNEEDSLLTNFGYGKAGVKISNSTAIKGCLIVFHASNPVPEKKEDIHYSVINIDNATWDSDGIFEYNAPHLGNLQIIGGAYFQRIITQSNIEWELVGIYLSHNDKWVIKSINKPKLSSE